jgi:hypothetical protein
LFIKTIIKFIEIKIYELVETFSNRSLNGLAFFLFDRAWSFGFLIGPSEMLRVPTLRRRHSGRKSSSNFLRVNRTTLFVLAIICGEIIRYYLFGFLLQWDSSFLQRPIFPSANNRRAPHPCDTDGSATSSSGVICPPQQLLNRSIKNSTQRSFQIHVFLYRRVDSAALLLRDLTDAEYKVLLPSAPHPRLSTLMIYLKI